MGRSRPRKTECLPLALRFPEMSRADRRRQAKASGRGAGTLDGLRKALETASVPGTPKPVLDRTRAILLTYFDTSVMQGKSYTQIVKELAEGLPATGIAAVELQQGGTPPGLACAAGCAFCCILTGDDGGTITEHEAKALYTALAPLAGQSDGRSWHPKACPSLDPETRACRAYERRPMICRSYVSVSAQACEKVSMEQDADGPGVLAAQTTYLVAHSLARVALKGIAKVNTFGMSEIAQAAVEGDSEAEALKRARHNPRSLDDERKRNTEGYLSALGH